MSSLRYEITEKQLSDIALAAAKEASRATAETFFGVIGVNIADNEQIQNFRDNLAFAQRLRLSTDAAARRFSLTLVSVIAAAFALAVWEGVKAIIHLPTQ